MAYQVRSKVLRRTGFRPVRTNAQSSIDAAPREPVPPGGSTRPEWYPSYPEVIVESQ